MYYVNYLQQNLNFMENLQIGFKLVIALFAVLMYIKIIGRTILNHVSGLDLVQNIILGGLVGGIIYNPNVSILKFAFVLFIWTFIISFVAYVCRKNGKLRRLFEGQIIPLVRKGKMNEGGFKKAKLDILTYSNLLKNIGIYDISDVYFAQMEKNGAITAFTNNFDNYAVLLVIESKINFSYLDGIGKDEDWLKDALKKEGYDDIEKIFIAQWSPEKFLIIPNSKEHKVKLV